MDTCTRLVAENMGEKRIESEAEWSPQHLNSHRSKEEEARRGAEEGDILAGATAKGGRLGSGND